MKNAKNCNFLKKRVACLQTPRPWDVSKNPSLGEVCWFLMKLHKLKTDFQHQPTFNPSVKGVEWSLKSNVSGQILAFQAFFCFYLQSPGNRTLYFALVLSSLILSWVESWVLDVKVRLFILLNNKLKFF